MVGTDHAVARAEDGERIAPYGLCHGAHGADITQAQCNVLVCARRAKRYLEQGVPHAPLEVGAYGMEGKGERTALAREVFVQLFLSTTHHVRRRFDEPHLEQTFHAPLVARSTGASLPVAQAEGIANGGQDEQAYGRVVTLIADKELGG